MTGGGDVPDPGAAEPRVLRTYADGRPRPWSALLAEATRPAVALFDLDGTLRHETSWLPGAQDVLARLTDVGVPVAFCSGRTITSMRELVADLPYVTHLAGGGGTVVEARDGDGWRHLAGHGLPPATVARILEWTAAERLETWVFTADDWVVAEASEAVLWDAGATGSPFRVGDMAAVADVTKMAIIPRDADEWERAYRLDAPGVEVVRAHPRILDLVPASAHEFKGADALIEDLGVAWADVLAAGDGHNDTGMLAAAGTSFLMPPLRVADLPEAGRAVGVRVEAPDLAALGEYLDAALRR